MATDGKENPADGLLGPVIKRRIAKASRIVQPIQRTNWPNSWSSSDHVAAGVLLFISGSLPLRLSLRIDAVSIGLIGQLGPDSLPVVRAKLFSGDKTIGCPLNSPAIDGAWLAASVAVLPLPNLHIRLDANSNSQLPHRQRTRGFQIVIEFHEAEAYSKC
jgi:hypothetical protein